MSIHRTEAANRLREWLWKRDITCDIDIAAIEDEAAHMERQRLLYNATDVGERPHAEGTGTMSIDIRVGMGVTLPDGREGKVTAFAGEIGADGWQGWEATVVVKGDPDPYLITDHTPPSFEHFFEEEGMCTSCDIYRVLSAGPPPSPPPVREMKCCDWPLHDHPVREHD